MKNAIILSALLVLTVCGAAKRSGSVKIEDFVGTWYSEYIHDPENLDDDLINRSFELLLEKDSTQANALRGWHFATVRGGRKVDGADYHGEPGLRGSLHGDTVYLHLVSSWEAEGEAKLYFDNSALIWELCKIESKREYIEHYMPERDTLQRTIERPLK